MWGAAPRRYWLTAALAVVVVLVVAAGSQASARTGTTVSATASPSSIAKLNVRRDTRPPSTPTRFAKAGATRTKILVTWKPSTDKGGVAGYRLYRSTTRVGSTAVTSYLYTGLHCGKHYKLAVAAYDTTGNRSPKVSLTASTTSCKASDTQAPSVPAGLKATGTTETSVSLAWTGSTDDVGVTGYSVYKDGARVGSTSATIYTLSGLSCGTSYTLAIDAYDAAGNRSGQASVAASTSPCPSTLGIDTLAPSTPTGLAVTGSTQTSISTSWSASVDTVGVAGYGVFKNGALAGSTSATTYTVSGLACGTSYALAVDAYDAAGNHSAQAQLSAATSACSTGTASVYLAPSGSDANPCTQAAPCLSFQRARNVASPGDTVEVAAGSYGSQTLTGDKAAPKVVFRPAAGATVTLGGLSLGSCVTCHTGADNLRFEDLHVNGWVQAYDPAHDFDFVRLTATNFYVNSVQNVLISGGSYGGVTDGTNSKVDLSGGTGYQVNRNITIDGVLLHDYRITPGSGQHDECLLIFSGTGITVRNSKFQNCEYYDIFMQHIASDRPLGGITLENNFFDTPWDGQGHQARVSGISFSQRGNTFSNVVVRYNSFRAGTGIEWSSDGTGGFNNASAVGNLVGVGACMTGVSYAYDIALNGVRCSSSDKTASSFGYVDQTAGDYHLTTGSPAIDAGDSSNYPSADIDGHGRPLGPAPDAGAQEAR